MLLTRKISKLFSRLRKLFQILSFCRFKALSELFNRIQSIIEETLQIGEILEYRKKLVNIFQSSLAFRAIPRQLKGDNLISAERKNPIFVLDIIISINKHFIIAFSNFPELSFKHSLPERPSATQIQLNSFVLSPTRRKVSNLIFAPAIDEIEWNPRCAAYAPGNFR